MKVKLLLLLLCMNLFTACHVGRFFYWNFADLKDNKKFPSLPIQAPSEKFNFNVSNNNPVKLPISIAYKGKDIDFESFLKATETVGFMLIRRDTILYEKYFEGYTDSTDVPSFSVAKSFVSALMGIAIAEGKVKSVQEPICNYFPELPREKFGSITIEHVLNMRSGIRFNESYINPFGDVAKYYYGTNLKKYIKHLKVSGKPDEQFEYISLNTQILGFIIERATGTSLEKYLEEKIWLPLGMEYPASWSIDSKRNKSVKAFCCLNAKMRDFAKFGRLYLNQGNWQGKQLVPKDWVAMSAHSDPKNSYQYSYQWWQNPEVGDFMAEGILGQYIYVNPAQQIVIVRLGKDYNFDYWGELFLAVAKAN